MEVDADITCLHIDAIEFKFQPPQCQTKCYFFNRLTHKSNISLCGMFFKISVYCSTNISLLLSNLYYICHTYIYVVSLAFDFMLCTCNGSQMAMTGSTALILSPCHLFLIMHISMCILWRVFECLTFEVVHSALINDFNLNLFISDLFICM